MEGIRRHVARHLVAYLALFVALGGTGYAAGQISSGRIANGGVTSADIANGTVRGADIANGTIRAADVARHGLGAAQLAPGIAVAGKAGDAGATGAAGPRGPRFGDGRQVPNMDNIACNTTVSVATLPVTVTESGRIWVGANGTLVDNASDAREYGLWLELRDATDTTTLAVSPAAWDDNRANAGADDAVMPLSVRGTLQAGGDTESPAPTFVAAPGSYVLHLDVLAIAAAACVGPHPHFGYNGFGGMSYMLLAPTH